MKTAIFVCALSVFVASSAHASIRITEVMSSSNGGGVPTSDWFEMTNYGSSAIDLTGWRMDDGSVNPLASVALNGVSSIAAGQSIIFIESAAGVVDPSYNGLISTVGTIGTQVTYASNGDTGSIGSAIGVPTPGAIALLGLAGLVRGRRRN